MNVKILVCCHKKDVCASYEPYMPIHVGKALNPDLDLHIDSDNSGDNISVKNASYCELTGLYWAWKNLKNIDVIGLCHYRRYFDFHRQVNQFVAEKQLKTKQFDSVDLSVPDETVRQAYEGTVFVAKPRYYNRDVFEDYSCSHYSDDIRVVERIIKSNYPSYSKAFYSVMSDCKLIHYNMFIMSWNMFDQYCSWIFDILRRAEEFINISNYDVNQKRVFGYIAERLLNVYLLANRVPVVRKPVLWFYEGEYPKQTPLKYTMKKILSFIIKKMKHPLKNYSSL